MIIIILLYITSLVKLNASDHFFIYLLDNLNYKVFKCYHIFLKIDFKSLLTNAGFIFGVTTFFINLICLLFFFFCSLKQLRLQIYKSLPDNKNLIKTQSKTEQKSVKEKNKNTNSVIPKRSKTHRNNSKSRRNSTKKKTNKSTTNSLFANPTSNYIMRKESFHYSLNYRSENKYGDSSLMGDIDLNFLPYSLAITKDHRNFVHMFFSIFKLKIEFFALLFYPENFTYKSYTLSMYTLGFFFGFFSNSMLYTDDVVSEKYHNNGKLNILTTIFLSLTSNFISWLIASLGKNFFIFNEVLILLIRDTKRKYDYILTFKKLYIVIKIKTICYYILSFIFIFIMTYYLVLFCTIYKESQNSLLINYAMGIVESLITSVCFTLAICMFRLIGLKYKNKDFYRTSVFLDQKL